MCIILYKLKKKRIQRRERNQMFDEFKNYLVCSLLIYIYIKERERKGDTVCINLFSLTGIYVFLFERLAWRNFSDRPISQRILRMFKSAFSGDSNFVNVNDVIFFESLKEFDILTHIILQEQMHYVLRIYIRRKNSCSQIFKM